MKDIVSRIDEEFLSSPIPGVIALSADDWVAIKEALAPLCCVPSCNNPGVVHICKMHWGDLPE